MLNSFPITVAVSAVLGFLAGLGVGGGSLLMIWMTVILHIDHPSARTINLLFFIPTAVISSIFHKSGGKLNLKKLVPAIVAGVASAALTGLIGKKMDLELLKKLFAFLLLFTGMREIFYRPRNAK